MAGQLSKAGPALLNLLQPGTVRVNFDFFLYGETD